MFNRLTTQAPDHYLDLVAGHLRSQIVAMHNILETIERTDQYEDEYIINAMKNVETETRRLRKFIEGA